MTREEAIEVIKAYRDKLTNSASNQLDGDIEALDMAIQALEQNESAEEWYKLFAEKLDEQEPCDKCVYSTKDGYCQYDDVSETIPPLEPCDNAVSREAVKELIKCGVSTDTYDDVEQVCKWIDALPSVTQKSGKWIHFAQSDDCSLCGYSTGKYGSPSKYCPNCGAKMESEE